MITGEIERVLTEADPDPFGVAMVPRSSFWGRVPQSGLIPRKDEVRALTLQPISGAMVLIVLSMGNADQIRRVVVERIPIVVVDDMTGRNGAVD